MSAEWGEEGVPEKTKQRKQRRVPNHECHIYKKVGKIVQLGCGVYTQAAIARGIQT